MGLAKAEAFLDSNPDVLCPNSRKRDSFKLPVADSPATWLIAPVESINQSRQVSGTSDASKTQSRLIRSWPCLA